MSSTLHARLRSLQPTSLPEIPFHLTVEKIYSDFIRYLVAHTRTFFEDRTPNGRNVWLNLIEYADFVIAHPNGWGLKEQSVLRRAAIQADLVRPSDADARIHFVTEAEASVHFCVVNANAHLAAKFKVRVVFRVLNRLFTSHLRRAQTSSYAMPEDLPSISRPMSSSNVNRPLFYMRLKPPGVRA